MYQLRSPLHPGKRIKWKRPLDKELRSMIRQKNVSYGDGMLEARTIQFMYSIKKIEIKSETKLD